MNLFQLNALKGEYMYMHGTTQHRKFI